MEPTIAELEEQVAPTARIRKVRRPIYSWLGHAVRPSYRYDPRKGEYVVDREHGDWIPEPRAYRTPSGEVRYAHGAYRASLPKWRRPGPVFYQGARLV